MLRIVTAFLITTLAGAGSALSESAVLSQVSPGVTLRAEAFGGSSFPARPLQILAPGSTLKLPAAATAVVVCSNDRFVEVTGPVQWQLGTESCRSGRPVAPGTYRRLRPSQGRAIIFHDSLLTEVPSRSDDENGKVPVLLRPRSPRMRTIVLGEASPTLVWTTVSRAQSYDLVLTRGADESVIADISCEFRAEVLTEPLRTCLASWPWSPLISGEEVELQVRAHTPDPDRPVRETDPSKLRLADAATLRTVENNLAAAAAAGLPKAAHQLGRAAVYSEAKLFNEAAEALGASLEESPQAVLAVRLADLYLGLGQLRAALNSYQRAENLLPPTGENQVRAALYLGRGRLYVRKNEDDLASDQLEKAATYFRRAGQDAEAATAATEAKRASQN